MMIKALERATFSHIKATAMSCLYYSEVFKRHQVHFLSFYKRLAKYSMIL